MSHFNTLLLPALCALVICLHLGYAWVRLALPTELQSYRLLLMPFVGLSLFLIITAAVTIASPLTPPQIALGMVVLAVPLNLWAWWQRRHTTKTAWSDVAYAGAIYAVMLFTFALAILPVWRWEVSLPIGDNWDASEFYVPLGRALQLVSQRDIATLPDNPLINIFSSPPVSGRIHAFSYFHAAVSSATSIEPLRSFVPVMGFVLALQSLAVYPLARVIGLVRWTSLLATVLLALVWLPLWVTYNSFSNHVLGVPLLPVALASSIVALRSGGWKALTTGGLFTAALATAYYPIMSAYAMFLAPIGLYLLWRRPDVTWQKVIQRGMLLAGCAFLMSGGAQFYFFFREGFLEEVLNRGAGYQIYSFMSLPDALGLAATFRGEDIASNLRLLVPALIAAGVFCGAALLSRQQPLLLVLVVGVVCYQIYMVGRSYHYGFYKGVSFALPIYAMLVAAGVGVIWQGLRRLSRRSVQHKLLFATPLAVGCVVGVVILGGLKGHTIWRIQESYTNTGPQLWSANEAEVTQIQSVVSPESSVLVVPTSARPPTFNSLISYAFLGHQMFGQFSTGYNELDERLKDGFADAALLPEGTDPNGFGYQDHEVRWSGAGMRLYGRDPGIRYHQSFGSGGRYPVITPGESLILQASIRDLVLSDEESLEDGAAGQGQLVVAMASFGPTVLEFQSKETQTSYDLNGGLVEIVSESLVLPDVIELRNTGSEPIYLWWGELREPGAPPEVLQTDEAFVQIQPEPLDDNMQVEANIRLHTQQLPETRQKLTALVVFSHIPETGRGRREIGQWVFFPNGEGNLRLSVDMEQLSVSLTRDGQPLEVFGATEPAGNGRYRVALLFANNTRIVYGATIWSWEVQDGVIAERATDAVLFDVIPLPRVATPLKIDMANGNLRLRGYTLPQQTVARGDTIRLHLVWQGLRHMDKDYHARVLVQDAEGQMLVEQTVLLGHPEYSTSRWQEGELADHPFTLSIPNTASPGEAIITVELLAALESNYVQDRQQLTGIEITR